MRYSARCKCRVCEVSRFGGAVRKEVFAEVRRSGPVIAVVLLVAVGIAMLAGGLWLERQAEWTVWGKGLTELAKAVLASGFVAAFFRLFELTGVMERALERFMLSDGFHGLVTDFRSVWAKVTARVFLQGAGRGEEETILADVTQAVSEQLLYDKNYYLRDLVTTLDVTLDPDGRTARVEQTQEYRIVRLNDKPAEIRLRFQARAECGLDGYALQEPRVAFTRPDGAEAAVDMRVERVEGASVTHIYSLGGHEEFGAKIVSSMAWDIRKDRVFEIVTRCICRNATLRCNDLGGQFRSTFVEYGLRERFRNEMSQWAELQRPGDLHRRLDGILLPHSGFAVVFDVIPRKAQAADRPQGAAKGQSAGKRRTAGKGQRAQGVKKGRAG